MKCSEGIRYKINQCIIDINKDIIFEEKRHWNSRNFKVEKKEGILYAPSFFNIDDKEIDQVAPDRRKNAVVECVNFFIKQIYTQLLEFDF